jgi:cytochrome c-type biogenesis protein CcmH
VKHKLLLKAGIILVILIAFPAGVMAEEALSPEALKIANGLNCPVCEGQSVRDSNSQLARDMRRTVQEKLDEGYTEQEVYDYFVDRYGVGILREPPKSGFFMTLWWAPVIGLAIGALALGTFVTQRRRGGRTTQGAHVSGGQNATDDDYDEDLSEYEERFLQDLDSDFNTRDRRS